MKVTPVDVSDELFARLREYFDERLESQGFTEGAYCALPEHPVKSAQHFGICCKNSLTTQDVVMPASSSLLWNVAKIFFATDPVIAVGADLSPARSDGETGRTCGRAETKSESKNGRFTQPEVDRSETATAAGHGTTSKKALAKATSRQMIFDVLTQGTNERPSSHAFHISALILGGSQTWRLGAERLNWPLVCPLPGRLFPKLQSFIAWPAR
jgi:hypothetical protein